MWNHNSQTKFNMTPEKLNKNCAFCDSSNIDLVMDFGEMALAGGFLKSKDFYNEPKFNMRMGFCNDCFAVQILDAIPPDLMFKDYFYFSSSIGTLKEHFKNYAEEVTNKFLDPSSAKVLEFGCNDGILLKPLADQNIQTVIGVDPAENVISTIKDKRINTIADYFTEKVADDVVDQFGEVDLVMANNAYAHIDDIQGTTRAVKKVLSRDGIFAFEVHYLGVVLDELQYDMIYHEHIYYYSLLSAINHFKRYSMTVFDIKQLDIHGGSYRFYVCNDDGKNANDISTDVKNLVNLEKKKGYNQIKTFKKFSSEIIKVKTDLMELLTKLKSEGYSIAGYGASGRANTMIQFCEIDTSIIDYMIDDSIAKQGFYTPGSHIEIKSNKVLHFDNPPDYVLIFAWTFIDEIKSRNEYYLKNGGKFIIPLPEVSIYSET